MNVTIGLEDPTKAVIEDVQLFDDALFPEDIAALPESVPGSAGAPPASEPGSVPGSAGVSPAEKSLTSVSDDGPVLLGDGEGTVTTTAITYYYYYLNGQRVAQSRDGVFTWMHADHLSSATRITDVTGLEIRRLAYASFGEEAENQGTGDDPKYKYTGKEHDNTGLYYFGARYYDPALCRFITADTVYDAGPQGLNRYSYVLNNPIIYRDPSGHLSYHGNEDPNLWVVSETAEGTDGYTDDSNLDMWDIWGTDIGEVEDDSAKERPYKTYRQLNWLYNIFGKTRKHVNTSARVFGVPPQVVATAIEMENAPGIKNSVKRFVKGGITWVGNKAEKLRYGEYKHDRGMGWSEGLANIKPSHAAELKKYYDKNYPDTFMAWKVNWSSEHLTSDDASISLAAAGMRRSLEEMSKYKGGDYNSYTIEELAEAAAGHNTPNAPNDWKNNKEWLNSYKGKDFQNDVNYATILLEQDRDKTRNLTFMH